MVWPGEDDFAQVAVTTQAPSFRATERSAATEGSRGISCRGYACHRKWRFLDSLSFDKLRTDCSLGMTHRGKPENCVLLGGFVV